MHSYYLTFQFTPSGDSFFFAYPSRGLTYFNLSSHGHFCLILSGNSFDSSLPSQGPYSKKIHSVQLYNQNSYLRKILIKFKYYSRISIETRRPQCILWKLLFSYLEMNSSSNSSRNLPRNLISDNPTYSPGILSGIPFNFQRYVFLQTAQNISSITIYINYSRNPACQQLLLHRDFSNISKYFSAFFCWNLFCFALLRKASLYNKNNSYEFF